jgi:hypothetical protein
VRQSKEQALVCLRCDAPVSEDDLVRRWGLHSGKWYFGPRRLVFHRDCLSAVSRNTWRDTAIFVGLVGLVVVVIMLVR